MYELFIIGYKTVFLTARNEICNGPQINLMQLDGVSGACEKIITERKGDTRRFVAYKRRPN